MPERGYSTTGGHDPDPLHVEATYLAGWDDGYEKAVADSFSPLAGLLIVALVSAIVGLLIGWAIGLAT